MTRFKISIMLSNDRFNLDYTLTCRVKFHEIHFRTKFLVNGFIQ